MLGARCRVAHEEGLRIAKCIPAWGDIAHADARFGCRVPSAHMPALRCRELGAGFRVAYVNGRVPEVDEASLQGRDRSLVEELCKIEGD